MIVGTSHEGYLGRFVVVLVGGDAEVRSVLNGAVYGLQ